MKKTLQYTALLAAMTLLFGGCRQSEFDDNYYDPEKSVTATFEGLFTGFLYNHSYENRNTILPRYWNLYTFQVPMPAKYAQVVGYTNSTGRYEQNTAYTEQRWEYFYNTYIAGFRSMEKKMTELPADEQKGYDPFMEVARILLYDQAAQLIDMWGDIPFTEAGRIITESGQLRSPKYDPAEELYNTFIDDLKRIADYLNAVDFSAAKKPQFDRHDIFFQGDLDKWKRYANSLRLRLAMRISYKDEDRAKTVVGEILNNAGTYPVVSSVAENLAIKAEGDVLRSVLNKHGQGIREGLIGVRAPGKMVNDLMAPAGDPRLEVLFSKNNAGDFVGVYETWNEKRQDDSTANEYFSRIDTATFAENDQFPGIIVTAAEISLFKAEALERWNIGTGTAQDAYEAGIRQSIDYYYAINAMNQNSNGTSFTAKTKPAEAAITAFLAHANIAYAGTAEQKLEKIASQQWVNFGVIQAVQAWAEVRRTGYPKLNFLEDPFSTGSKTPPNRLLYPNSERTLNKDNYAQVANKDRMDAKVFWHVK